MKKLYITFCALTLCSLVSFSQTTNYFWSAGYTSNYVTTNLSARLATNNAYVPGLITNAAPVKTIFFGLTTNTAVLQPGGTGFITNYWFITNGIITLITNSAT